MRATGYVHGSAGKTVVRDGISRNHLLRFFLVGAVASLVDIALLFLFSGILGIWYLPAAAASYCCGIVVSYLLNRRITFGSRDRDVLHQFTTFTVISGSCLMVNVCIVWLFVELGSFHYLSAKVIATAGAFFWNYYGQSRVTFRDV